MNEGRKLPLITRAIVLALLIAGAVVFVFPFLTMVCTSVKMDDEMSADNFTLLPREPRPQQVSPYVNRHPDRTIARPTDMSREVWASFEDPFRRAVRARVVAWLEKAPQVKRSFAGISEEAAIQTLTDTVGNRVLARISDKARQAGAAAMAAEIPKLADDETIESAFETYVPCFMLAEVTGRPDPFTKLSLGEEAQWRVTSGPANLTLAEPPMKPGAVLTYDFRQGGREGVTVRFVPAARATAIGASGPATAVGDIDYSRLSRLYLSYRPDRSWCRMHVAVIRDGQRYTVRDALYADEILWTELELRWPDPETDNQPGRSWRILYPDGPAPAGEPKFAIEVKLTPSSLAGAWWGKATRNYSQAFRQVPIGRYVATSIALAILNIVLVTLASSFVAYAFARVEFPGRDMLFGVLLATMMLPGQVTMIPTFLVWKNLGAYNTLLPLWLPSAFGTAFFIFMMRQFLKAIPRELEEAARIDGCGFLRIYWHVMLPLIRPTLAAVAMFAFLGTWNNFMGPLIYVNDERLFNLAYGLYKLQRLAGDNQAMLMAGAFIMTLPIILLFFAFQRYFIQGIALTGLGGR